MKCKHCNNKALECFDYCYRCKGSWSKTKLAHGFKLVRMYNKRPTVGVSA